MFFECRLPVLAYSSSSRSAPNPWHRSWAHAQWHGSNVSFPMWYRRVFPCVRIAHCLRRFFWSCGAAEIRWGHWRHWAAAAKVPALDIHPVSWSDHKARLNKNQDQPTRTNKALNISHMYCDQHEGTWSNNTPYCHSLPYFRVLCSWFRAQDVEWTFSWRGTFFQLRRWFSLEVSGVNGQHGSTYKGRQLKTLCPGLKRETVLELHRLNLGTLPWRTLGVLPPCAQGELAAKLF